MATPQLSPGILTREVDLTVGRADNVSANVGAIAGPFAIGPVEEPILISNETDLINTFGKPLSTDGQYEYWMSASSFLTYGGLLRVARCDGTTLNNANAGVGLAATTNAKVKNFDNYNYSWSGDSVEFYYAAKNPGSWANSLKVCVIDDLADQILGISTTDLGALGATIGAGVTAAVNTTIPGSGSTSNFTGYLKGIVTGVTTSASGSSSISVKIVSRVSASGTESQITYGEFSPAAAFTTSDTLRFVNSAGINTGSTAVPTTVNDWYKSQTLGLTNSTVYWNSIAPKPVTNAYALSRNAKNDAMHIVVVDDTGSITGVQGTILEKHTFLSKATDSVSNVSSPTRIFYKNYVANASNYIYAGRNPSTNIDVFHGTNPVPTGFTTYSGVAAASFTPISTADGQWNQNAQGKTYSAIGNKTYTLSGGVDYSAAGGMTATLGNLSTAYDLFANKNEIKIDFLIN